MIKSVLNKPITISASERHLTNFNSYRKDIKTILFTVNHAQEHDLNSCKRLLLYINLFGTNHAVQLHKIKHVLIKFIRACARPLTSLKILIWCQHSILLD